jgi:6-pyruvoyltetrahydropterin/6-carboxytetrahydropterin synthase
MVKNESSHFEVSGVFGGVESVATSDTSETRLPMKAHLTRRYWFSASHRLHSDAMSDEENRATYGKCNNPFGHGHNYALEVTVSGSVDPTTGMVCNLADLDGFVARAILSRYEHANLNTLPEFSVRVPTTENLCIEIYEILQRGFQYAHLDKVRMDETMMNSFEYAGGAEARH